MKREALLLFVALASLTSSTNLLINVWYPQDNIDGYDLFIRGNDTGLNWNQGIKLTRVEQDHWQYSLQYENSAYNNILAFKILVEDAAWEIGANHLVQLPSNSASVTVYPFFFTYKGTYQYIRNVWSPELNNTRDLVIYTPPSYYENIYKVIENALVMHDGQNLFNASTAFLGNAWLCQDTVNKHVVEGDMQEIIIIGVDNTADRINELTYSYDPTEKAGGKGDLYLDFIQSTVLPIIQKSFRVKLKKENLGILGSSLGGLISCYAGWTRSDIYGRSGCMSSSFWWNNEDFNNIIMNKYKPPTNILFYLDSGDSGPDNDDEAQTKRVRDNMITNFGYEININLFYYLDHGGQHSETYWRQRFWIPMTEFYPIVTEQLNSQ